jgi:uncharacterized integral membrane protein
VILMWITLLLLLLLTILAVRNRQSSSQAVPQAASKSICTS